MLLSSEIFLPFDIPFQLETVYFNLTKSTVTLIQQIFLHCEGKSCAQKEGLYIAIYIEAYPVQQKLEKLLLSLIYGAPVK